MAKRDFQEEVQQFFSEMLAYMTINYGDFPTLVAARDSVQRAHLPSREHPDALPFDAPVKKLYKAVIENEAWLKQLRGFQLSPAEKLSSRSAETKTVRQRDKLAFEPDARHRFMDRAGELLGNPNMRGILADEFDLQIHQIGLAIAQCVESEYQAAGKKRVYSEGWGKDVTIQRTFDQKLAIVATRYPSWHLDRYEGNASGLSPKDVHWGAPTDAETAVFNHREGAKTLRAFGTKAVFIRGSLGGSRSDGTEHPGVPFLPRKKYAGFVDNVAKKEHRERRTNNGAKSMTEEPFIIIWAPENERDHPELSATLRRLKEPEQVEAARRIARENGIPGFEFQIYEIYEPNSDDDGKLSVRLCFDQKAFESTGKNRTKMLDAVELLLKLDTPMATGDYHASGKERFFHDVTHVKQYGLLKAFDSRPELMRQVGA